MILQRTHPEIVNRDCEHCLKFIYDEKTGQPLTIHGKEVPRHEKAKAPCRMPRGCPKGTPENPRSLTPRNVQAIEFYREKMAVGRVPDDPLSERIVSIISHVDREVFILDLSRVLTDSIVTAFLAAGGK